MNLLSFVVSSLRNQHFKLLTLNNASMALKQFLLWASLLFLLFFNGIVRSVIHYSILVFCVLLQAMHSEITV